MPFKDPEKKKENHRRWRKKSIEAGYGKALYERRAQRLRNEVILRHGIEEALMHIDAGDAESVKYVLLETLKRAPVPGPPKEYMPDPDSEIASGADDGKG
jgi:hypothetical protein